MDVFIRYKKIKERINGGGEYTDEYTNEYDVQSLDTPVLWYTGQYQKAKDNVSILAPAIYIEMPKNLKIDYFPGKLQVAKDAVIKIHILSIAPYKSIDNSIQDAQVEKHNQLIKDVQVLLNGFQIKDANNKVIASQFILQKENPMNYMSSFAFSVLEYKSEFYEKEPD